MWFLVNLHQCEESIRFEEITPSFTISVELFLQIRKRTKEISHQIKN